MLNFEKTRHTCTYQYTYRYLYLVVNVYMHTYLYVYVQCLQTRKIIIPKNLHLKTKAKSKMAAKPSIPTTQGTYIPNLYLCLSGYVHMHMCANVHKYASVPAPGHMRICTHIHKCTQHLQTRETFESNLNRKRQNGRHAKISTTRHACTYLHIHLYLSEYMYMHI